MGKFIAVFLLMFLSVSTCTAQNDIRISGKDCGLHGNANPKRSEYVLNEKKNRYSFPKKSDYLTNVNIEDLISNGDELHYPTNKAVILIGYVYNVKNGGVETCNCKTKDVAYRDTHIELTPDNKHTSAEYRLIVEVTPRIRAIMAARGIDWSTETLRSTIMGHTVKVSGWLFYDEEHKGQAFASAHAGNHCWRASCWEVHPVTYIKVID
jgi:hypothetical protein